jgi:hypothetical protein
MQEPYLGDYSEAEIERMEDEFDRIWDKRVKEYTKHEKRIEKSLPKAMQEFCHISLHDGRIQSVCRQADKVILKVDGIWVPKTLVTLTFQGVKQSSGLDSIWKDIWLYEEVSLSRIGKFKFSVLTWTSEFSIVADDFEFKEEKR